MEKLESLKSSLQTRYQAILESTSDPLFYKNIHLYVDFIMKNPALAKIINDSDLEYSKKHSQIWRERKNTEEEIDVQDYATRKLEFFNLYASDFVTLFVRIYSPIEDYKTTDDPDYLQDPVALLMLRGIEWVKSRNWHKRPIEPNNRWGKKNLERYNRWFAGQRGYYTNTFKQFHYEFLGAMDYLKDEPEEPEPKPEKIKIPLTFNERTGDFTFLKTSGNFSPNSQEFKIFSILYCDTNQLAEYSPLLKVLFPNIDKFGKSHKFGLYTIIRNIKEKLGILPESKTSNPDIIKNVPKFGYRLTLSSIELRAEQS
jgi:hypothetical protein